MMSLYDNWCVTEPGVLKVSSGGCKGQFGEVVAPRVAIYPQETSGNDGFNLGKKI